MRRLGVSLPIVPRPPTLKWPKRLKGAEQVTMLGVTLRMTITSDGSDGTSLDDILRGRQYCNERKRQRGVGMKLFRAEVKVTGL